MKTERIPSAVGQSDHQTGEQRFALHPAENSGEAEKHENIGLSQGENGVDLV